MAQATNNRTALRVSDLSQSGSNGFELRPDEAARTEMAAALDLLGLRKLAFAGEIKAWGATDWVLTARLGATVVQPCVVTLEPVTTRIDKTVTRRFIHDYATPEEPEAEMPEDETIEALGAWIDPALIMAEALALALPDYPRAEGAELGAAVFTQPGSDAMTDADARPFASLADFKAKLEKGGGGQS
ncbi:MAG: DUF177 domain-containing protein [Pseudomonadota bacterium]